MYCSNNSIEYDNKKHITVLEWFVFACILVYYFIKDFLEEIIILYKNVLIKNKKGIFAGSVLVFITICSWTALVLYNIPAPAILLLPRTMRFVLLSLLRTTIQEQTSQFYEYSCFLICDKCTHLSFCRSQRRDGYYYHN